MQHNVAHQFYYTKKISTKPIGRARNIARPGCVVLIEESVAADQSPEEIMTDSSKKARAPEETAGVLTGLFHEGQLVWQLFGDPRVASTLKIALPILAALYVLSPVDLIPDFIPVLGQMDDLAILALAVKLFLTLAPPQVVAEHRQKIWHPNRNGQTGQTASEGETVEGEYRVVE
jgi:uncharacterized membrane protein YkvA (DUF1232 family)